MRRIALALATVLAAVVGVTTPAHAQYDDTLVINVVIVINEDGVFLSISGTGCGADAGVEITVGDGEVSVETTADDDGDFSSLVELPESLVFGPQDVLAECDGIEGAVTVVVFDFDFDWDWGFPSNPGGGSGGGGSFPGGGFGPGFPFSGGSSPPAPPGSPLLDAMLDFARREFPGNGSWSPPGFSWDMEPVSSTRPLPASTDTGAGTVELAAAATAGLAVLALFGHLGRRRRTAA